MVIVAFLVLNIFHPGYSFPEGYVQNKYANLFMRKQKAVGGELHEKESPARGEPSCCL